MPVLIWQMLHYFLKNLKVERSVWDRAPHSEHIQPCKSDWCYMEFNSTSDRNHGGSLTRQNLLPDLFDAATDQNRNPNVLTFNCHRQVTSLAIQNPAVDQPISVLTDSFLLLCIYLFLLLLSLWQAMSLRGATRGEVMTWSISANKDGVLSKIVEWLVCR